MKKIGVFIIFLLPLFYSVICSAQEIAVGSSEQEVVALMGEPMGRAESDDSVVLDYPDIGVLIKGGKVVESWKKKTEVQITEFAEAEAVDSGSPAPLKKTQSTVTNTEKKKTKKYKKVRTINKKGKKIELSSILVPDKITIVDFYADWCGPCQVMGPKLEKFAIKTKDVYLVKVNIVNWKTPVTKQYNIDSIPHVCVYDQKGSMIGEPTSSFERVRWYVEKQKK